MGKHSKSGSTRRKKAPRAAKKRLPPAQSEAIYDQAVAWLKANLSSYHTLRRRFLNLHRSHQHAHENQMLLTHAQEAVLVEWMEKDAQEAYPWSRVKLKVRVQELCGRLPSDEWIAAFRRRHPDKLRFRGTSGIDPKRAQCFNPGTVRDHFEKFGKICENYRVILNFDETGRQKGGGRKRNGKKFFTAAGDRARYKARDANLELITVIECCATDGTMLDPGFIFAGTGNYTAEWFEGQEGRQISVGLTGNGWTNDEQCLHWFDNVLAPQARAKTLSEDERVLLVFDGHHSHLTDELIDLGTKWRIDFYLLPSHTTHKLQPLDVGCFGPMQLRWVQRCEALVEETGQALERGRIVAEYLAIRDAAITPEVVMAAWRKTGLHPFNPNVFQDSDFAPSRPYSTQAHLPASYPVVPEVLERATPTEAPASTPALDASALESPTDTTATTTSPSDVNAPGPSAAIPPGPADGGQDSGASELASSSDLRDRSPSPMDIDDPLSPMDVDEPPIENTSTVDVLDATAAALSQFLPLPGPHFPQFHRTPISSSATESEQIEVLTTDLSILDDLYRSEFERRQRAESHCAHAAKAIIVLKARVAEKDTKKKSKAKRFTSKAKFLMGPEAMVEQQRSKQEKLAKVREDAEKRERQAGKDEEQRQRREKLVNDANTVFSGALKGKKKCDLQAIAFLLGLPFERKCEDLCSSIQDCLLQDRTKYQSNPRFTNLYPALDRLNAPAVAATASQPDDSHAASNVSQDVILPHPPLPTPCSFPQPAPSSSLGAPPPLRHDENIPPLSRGSLSALEAAPSARQYGVRPPLAPMVSQPQYSAQAPNFSYNAVAGPSSHTSMYYTP